MLADKDGQTMKADNRLSLTMARNVLSRYKPGMMRWHYEHGLVIYSCLEAGRLYGVEEFLEWAYAMYDPKIGETGSIATYREGEYNLDQINAGRNLFALYAYSKQERFALASKLLKDQLDKQPRTQSGVYWHKQVYPWQIWLDGLYMQGPFKAQYCALHGEESGIEDVIDQLLIASKILRDGKTGLLYHAYDESRGQRWSDETTGLSPHFWSRAIGWYCMAILDVLDFVPASNPKRALLVAELLKTLDALLVFQQQNGMWYQVVDKKEAEGNYLETSGTSMFAYSLLKAVRLGLAPDTERYTQCALDALEGIKETYLRVEGKDELHLGGICSVAGLGGNPYRDGSLRYYLCEPVVEDDFKGVGPFILACLEAERI